MTERSFVFLAHANPPPEVMARDVFGGVGEFDPRKLMIISNDPVDVRNLFTPRDFWVYFFGMPVPWRVGEECTLGLEYSVEVGPNRVRIADNLQVWNVPASNLTTAKTDAALALELYNRCAKMSASDLAKGQRISTPIEAKVFLNYSQGKMDLNVLGFSDLKVTLIYSPDARQSADAQAVINAGAALKLQWPSPAAQDTLRKLSSDSWIRFTGTALYHRNGTLFVVPDSVTVAE